MSQKPPYRKRHLFARSLDEVVKAATKPMLDKQGKLYGALIANWPAIVGAETARISRPGRLQFPTGEASGAALHLNVHPAKAAEMPYMQEQLLEQCARYFGYRAITRLIIHASPELAVAESKSSARSALLREPERSERGGSGSDGGSAPSVPTGTIKKPLREPEPKANEGERSGGGTPPAPEAPPKDMRELLQRMRHRIMSDTP